MTARRKIFFFIILSALALGVLLYFYNQIYLTQGGNLQNQTILIEKGDNALVVGEKMTKTKVIANKYYLVFYLWRNGQLHDLVAGVYDLKPGLTIPEVARIIIGGEVANLRIPITFPEGWVAKDMADRLTANGFAGTEFLNLVNDPPAELKNKYDFLQELGPQDTLEGYLFPDTYYFAKDATAQDIVDKLLKNFAVKITPKMEADIAGQGKKMREILIMASIIEKEARFASDMPIVASVFYNRLAIGQRLQSDATLEYVLGNNKIQHSAADLQNSSPYNTYRVAGLPPGPVSNPGLNALNAAIYPEKTDYYYFLTDLKTNKTIFAKTFAEHVANKAKYGL